MYFIKRVLYFSSLKSNTKGSMNRSHFRKSKSQFWCMSSVITTYFVYWYKEWIIEIIPRPQEGCVVVVFELSLYGQWLPRPCKWLRINTSKYHHFNIPNTMLKRGERSVQTRQTSWDKFGLSSNKMRQLNFV